MNFVLNFCKITSSSRIFSRNFYLPLLKPLTPKDAYRTYRITGKWLLSGKKQRYIPVLLDHQEKQKTISCRKRNPFEKKTNLFEKTSKKNSKKHELIKNYDYLIPTIDPNNDSHKLLLNIFDGINSNENGKNLGKNGKNGTFFVYKVDHKQCGVLLNGNFENAIKDGEIIDVLISQRDDKLLVKLKNFKKIAIEMSKFNFDENDSGEIVLYCGEGATSVDEEKFHHHGKFIMSIAKIFEDKEREAEEWELELMRIIEKRIKRALEATKEYNDIFMSNSNSLDWQKYEKDCKKVVEQIAEPIVENHIAMVVQDLDKTKDVAKIIDHAQMLCYLPTMAEIPDVINSMANAKFHEIVTDDKRKLSGIKVTLASGKECFISGQMVHTEDGDVFVPGQTIINEFGDEYVPGITINLNNEITLINGIIVGEENNEKPMFCPSESAITNDGQLTFAVTKEERAKYQKQPKNKQKKTKKKREKINENDAKKEPESNASLAPENGEKELNSDSELRKKKPKKKREKTNEEICPVPEPETVTSLITETEPEITEKEPNSDSESRITVSPDLEQQRQELEKLRKELFEYGLDEIVAGLEDKTSSLREKLEELRKIKVCLVDNSDVTYVNSKMARECAEQMTKEESNVAAISEILLFITQKCAILKNRKSIKQENIKNNTTTTNEKFYCLKTTLKEAIFAANDAFKKRPKDQVNALESSWQLLQSKIETNDVQQLTDLTNYERRELMMLLFKELTVDLNENKFELLKNIDQETIVERIEKILENDAGYLIASALRKLTKCQKNDFILKKIVQIIQTKNFTPIKSETDVIRLLRTSIAIATKDVTNDWYSKTQLSPEFLDEAISFSLALGKTEISENLKKGPNYNQPTLDLLKRLILIKKLSENDFTSKKALERMFLKPEMAKNDRCMIDLVKECSILNSDTTNSILNNSNDVPIKYLKNGNYLAIENYLISKGVFNRPVMLCKKGFELILPKESSRAVLSGRVSYLLIDEFGNGTVKSFGNIEALKSKNFHEKDEFQDVRTRCRKLA